MTAFDAIYWTGSVAAALLWAGFAIVLVLAGRHLWRSRERTRELDRALKLYERERAR